MINLIYIFGKAYKDKKNILYNNKDNRYNGRLRNSRGSRF